MSNNKLNCDTDIQSLKDQISQQQRRISIFQNTQDLTLKNAQDVNKLISNANESVFCGPGSDCYKNAEIERLKKKYENKQVNKKTAPEQLDSARKNYYTYAFGQPGYIKKETGYRILNFFSFESPDTRYRILNSHTLLNAMYMM